LQGNEEKSDFRYSQQCENKTVVCPLLFCLSLLVKKEDHRA
jgi:hypothetical protein